MSLEGLSGKMTTIRKIPPLTGQAAIDFINKANNPTPKEVTKQELAIYKALKKQVG